MFKKYLFTSILCLGCLSFACSDDSNDTTTCPKECPNNCTNGVCNTTEETCETLSCNQVGGMEHACFTINGKAKCEIKCLTDKEGEHALCWQNPSLDQSIMHAITEACVKDDKGALYATIKNDEECPIGCTQGVCDKVDVCEDDNSCLMNNYQDGRDYRCFTLSDGSKGCAPKCVKEEPGGSVFACQMDVTGAKSISFIDYCRQDFSTGTQHLYSVASDQEECEHGCNEETGQCESILPDVDQTCATMNCEKDGGRPSACFTIDGKARCANTCLGDKEEEHTVCWASGSLGLSATPDSVTETCAKDDNDKLYVVGESTSTPCTNGCDEETGQCNEASEP